MSKPLFESSLNENLLAARAAQDCQAVIERIPYARYLGISAERLVQEPCDGAAATYRCYLPFQQKLIGNAALPALHGGVISGFAETAALLAVLMSDSTQQRMPKSIDFSIDYVRSAGRHTTCADCTIVRQGLSIALVQATVWQKKPQRIVATARAHFLLKGPSAVDGPALP